MTWRLHPLVFFTALVGLGLVGLGVAGCGGKQTPQRTVAAYAGALEREDAAAARALMSPELREATSAEQFEADFARRVSAGRSLQRQLRVAADSEATLTATLDWSRYEAIDLVWDDGRWSITSGVADVGDRSTPRAAVRTFVRAVSAGDAELLLALVPSEARGWTTVEEIASWLIEHEAELAERVALIEASLDRPLVEAGERATLNYGPSTLELVHEQGGWVIVDFD